MEKVVCEVMNFKAHAVGIRRTTTENLQKAVDGVRYPQNVSIISSDWSLENQQVEHIFITEDETINVNFKDIISDLEHFINSQEIWYCSKHTLLDIQIIETRNNLDIIAIDINIGRN